MGGAIFGVRNLWCEGFLGFGDVRATVEGFLGLEIVGAIYFGVERFLGASNLWGEGFVMRGVFGPRKFWG